MKSVLISVLRIVPESRTPETAPTLAQKAASAMTDSSLTDLAVSQSRVVDALGMEAIIRCCPLKEIVLQCYDRRYTSWKICGEAFILDEVIDPMGPAFVAGFEFLIKTPSFYRGEVERLTEENRYKFFR